LMQLETILSTLLVVFVVLSVVGFYLARRYYRRWQTRQTLAYQIGGRQAKGDMYQILGTFAVLDEYEQVILLSTTSKQSSLDLIGIRDDMIDFVEFKKKGAPLQGSERKIKKLVDERKVRYIIKDIDLPQDLQIGNRTQH